jgi:hypothetical protein
MTKYNKMKMQKDFNVTYIKDEVIIVQNKNAVQGASEAL